MLPSGARGFVLGKEVPCWAVLAMSMSKPSWAPGFKTMAACSDIFQCSVCVCVCVCACVCVCVCVRARACSVAQLHLTLCDAMDDSPPGSSVHGILQARILQANGVASHFLLQGIFPIQGLNPHLLHLLLWEAGVFCFVLFCLFVFLTTEPPGKPFEMVYLFKKGQIVIALNFYITRSSREILPSPVSCRLL